MNPVTYDILTQRIKRIGNLPVMPAILRTLTTALSLPSNNIDLDKIVDSISYDKSLAAQCLRLANSALFRQRGEVTSIRDAVAALGLWRIRDLAFSCSLPAMFPTFTHGIGKELFWRHAFGTAVVSQKLGQAFSHCQQDHTYLCGLLHDIGIVVNGILFPEDFRDVLEEAIANRESIESAEKRILGFTHAESGRILAEQWRLPVAIADTIEYHFHPGDQGARQEVTNLVHVADLFCQLSGMGLGYTLHEDGTQSVESIWAILCQTSPRAADCLKSEYSVLVQDYIEQAKATADQVFSEVLVG